MNEEGYTGIPSFQIIHIKHIEQLESLLERVEIELKLERFLGDNRLHPNDYEERTRDVQALRYAIATLKWLNGNEESEF
jgi:hypothetical protein